MCCNYYVSYLSGDLVLLASGSAIPADSRVNEGEIEVDEAALTGESLPVSKFQASNCLMGSTVVRGEVMYYTVLRCCRLLEVFIMCVLYCTLFIGRGYC